MQQHLLDPPAAVRREPPNSTTYTNSFFSDFALICHERQAACATSFINKALLFIQSPSAHDSITQASFATCICEICCSNFQKVLALA